ncbi:MAG TPA: hypothetical protein VEF36_09525 [Roseiarcus sp.]|nr:hypothetical protein [Roseiarcus sp.]
MDRLRSRDSLRKIRGAGDRIANPVASPAAMIGFPIMTKYRTYCGLHASDATMTRIAGTGAIVDIARQSSYAARPAPRDVSLPCEALPPIAAALDAGLLLLASVAGEIGYQYCTTNEFASLDGAAGIGLVSAALFALSARVEGLYRLQALLAPASNLARITVTLAVSQLAVTCILFLLKVGSEYSRGGMIAFAALAFCLEPVGRLMAGAAARSGIRRGAIKGRRVVTIGDADELESAGESDFLQFGMEETARVALRGDSRGGNGGLGEGDRARIAQAIKASRDLQAL